MTLHILSQPPSHCAYKSCLEHLAEKDTLILINDGVYALQTPHLHTKSRNIFALEHDVAARGIDANTQQLINYDTFVELSCQHNPIQSWY